MKTIPFCKLICAGLILILAFELANCQSRPIGYTTFKYGRAGYHMVTADFRTELVSAETVHSQKLTSVWTMIKQSQPAVAITGTFFAPSCQRPVADVLVDGKLTAKGDRGSVVAVDWFGKVSIFDSRFKKKVDWSLYRFALRGAIRVLTAGKVNPNPKAQHFRDRRLWGRAARTAVGITKSGKLVLLATRSSVTLSELGKAMLSRGVRDAISLDGGSSTCLYYRGAMVISPGRKLSNLFVVHERAPYSLPTADAISATNRRSPFVP